MEIDLSEIPTNEVTDKFKTLVTLWSRGDLNFSLYKKIISFFSDFFLALVIRPPPLALNLTYRLPYTSSVAVIG